MGGEVPRLNMKKRRLKMAQRKMEKQTTSTSNNVVVENKNIEEKIEPKKKVFEQNDGIMCKSLVQGRLNVEGPKTKMIYNFSHFGDETEIEYRDLVALVRTKDVSVFSPRFVVIDDDFLDEFPNVKKFYDNEYSVRNITDILELDNTEMIEKIKNLPKGAFEALRSIAAERVMSGEIDSVRKIKSLDIAFGTDLNFLGEFLSED
jgi:hypothetical protein